MANIRAPGGHWPAAPALLGWALGVAALAATGCDLPRDPRGTESRITGGEMRVGVTESPPWIVFRGGEVEGLEAELVRGLAERAHARIVWVRGRSEDLVEALDQAELALLAGGLTESDSGIEEAGKSIPYLKTRLIVAVPPGEPRPESLRGVRIATRPASGAAPGLKRRGAIVVPSDDPAGSGLPAAVEDWEARARGLWPTGVVLAEKGRVMAVPPGENGWLRRVDRYLHERGPGVEKTLARGAHR